MVLDPAAILRPAPPAPKGTTRPSRHKNVVLSFNGSSTDTGTVNEGPIQFEPKETTRSRREPVNISSFGTVRKHANDQIITSESEK